MVVQEARKLRGPGFAHTMAVERTDLLVQP